MTGIPFGATERPRGKHSTGQFPQPELVTNYIRPEDPMNATSLLPVLRTVDSSQDLRDVLWRRDSRASSLFIPRGRGLGTVGAVVGGTRGRFRENGGP